MFFVDLRLKCLIKQFSVIIFVHDIKKDKYLINNYFCLLIYLTSKIDNKIVIAHFYYKMHIIKNLKAKFFLEINIIDSKCIIVSTNKYKLIIKSC